MTFFGNGMNFGAFGGTSGGGGEPEEQFLTGGTAYATDFWDANATPAKAFDGDVNTGWQSENSGDTFRWIGYKIPEARTAITLRCRSSSDGQYYLGINDGTLQGSNDSTNGTDGSWTDIHTGINARGAGSTWYQFALTNSTAYTFYRIRSTTLFGPGNSMNSAEIELYNYVL
jgi:hypothetical protein